MCWMFVAGKGMTLCYLIYKGPFFYFKFWILISGNGVTLYYTDPQTERTPGVDDRLVMLMMKKINYKQLGKVISAFRWYNGADMGHRKKRPEMTNFFLLYLTISWTLFDQFLSWKKNCTICRRKLALKMMMMVKMTTGWRPLCRPKAPDGVLRLGDPTLPQENNS